MNIGTPDRRADELRRERLRLERITPRIRSGRGKGFLHWENVPLLRGLIKLFLVWTGLRIRGERNALNLQLTNIVFRFPDLPPAFHGFRILQLSDLHIDGLPDLPRVIASRVAGIDVDLCVLTGDFRFELGGAVDGAVEGMKTVLAAVETRHGSTAVPGNHDTLRLTEELERFGVTVLLNRSWELRRKDASLWFLGVDDPHYYGCHDLASAMRGVPKDAFTILLAHSPELYREAADMGVRCYLCGHTHAGQVRLPLVGAPMVNARCPRRFSAGVWRHRSMWGYTSAGAGSSCVPVRFMCPPEVTLIELTRGEFKESGISHRSMKSASG